MRVYGAKYDSNLTAKEIAVKVRGDIKAAVKAGELPKAKYSVRIGGGSLHSTIDVGISELPASFRLYNEKRLQWDRENPHKSHHDGGPEVQWIHSDEARALCEKVTKMLEAYNHDGSDTLSDYWDVKFYGHVDFGFEWSKAKREQEMKGAGCEQQHAGASV